MRNEDFTQPYAQIVSRFDYYGLRAGDFFGVGRFCMTREEIENECLVAEPSLRKMFVDFAFACCAKQVEEDAEIVQKLRVYRMTAAEIANVIRRNAPKVK